MGGSSGWKNHSLRHHRRCAFEQERIAELVMLYRADHLASRDGGALSHEIDGAASQIARTHDWLRDLEFDTSPSDIPDSLTAAAPLKLQH